MTICMGMLDKCNKCSNQMVFLNNNNNKCKSVGQQTNECLVSVVLLDNTVLDIHIDVKHSIGELFQKICDKLQLKEFDIFGLAQKSRSEFIFLSNDEKISKLCASLKKSKNLNVSSSSSLNNLNSGRILSSVATTNSQTTLSSNLNNLATRFIHNLNENLSNISHSIIYSLSSNGTNSYSFTNNCSTNDAELNHQRYKVISHLSSTDFSSSSRSSTRSSTSLSSETNSNNAACSCYLMESLLNFTIYFRVKFYVTDPLLLRDQQTRYFYYLQLKQNFICVNHRLNEEKYFILASLALLADLGNFNPNLHVNKYFDLTQYFPNWIIKKLGETYIYENLPRLHRQQSTNTPISAQNKFCAELSNDEYPYNLHLYTVCKNKEEQVGSICLGIAPKGVLIFGLNQQTSEIFLISTFSWSSLTKINAEKKKFEVFISVESKSRRYTYYTNYEKFSKYLLELSKITHAFTINIFGRLADQKTLANYVNESYSEKILALNCDLNESYEEREVNDDFKLSDNDLPKIDLCKIKETRRNSNTNSSNKNTNKSLDFRLINDSSSCSISSSSSSYYETPICLYPKSQLDNLNNKDDNQYLVTNKNNNFYYDSINASKEFTTIEKKNLKIVNNPFNPATSLIDNYKITSNEQDDLIRLNYVQSIKRTCPRFTDPSKFRFGRADTFNNNINKNSNFSSQNKRDLFQLSKNKMAFNIQFEEANSNLQLTNVQNSNYFRNNLNQLSQTFTTTSNNNNNDINLASLNYSYNLKPINNGNLLVNRSFLPPPPPLPLYNNTHNFNKSKSYFSQILNNNNKRNHVEANDQQHFSNDYPSLRNNDNFDRLTNDDEERISMRSPIVSTNAFLYRQNLNNSSSFLQQSNNVKFKKPPSYEESLRKIKKSSNQSSGSSIYNHDSELSSDSRSGISSSESGEAMRHMSVSVEENLNKIINDERFNDENDEDGLVVGGNNEDMFYDELYDYNSSNEHSPEEEKKKQASPIRKEFNSDNTIELSIENLEQIRMKAASMSLPLLTALCSDTFIIRSLSKTKREGSC